MDDPLHLWILLLNSQSRDVLFFLSEANRHIGAYNSVELLCERREEHWPVDRVGSLAAGWMAATNSRAMGHDDDVSR